MGETQSNWSWMWTTQRRGHPNWPESLRGSWCFQSAGRVALLSTPNRPRLSLSMFFTLQNSWLLVFYMADTQLSIRIWHEVTQPATEWPESLRSPWWCGRGCWGGAAAGACSGSVCGSWGWSSSGGNCEEHLRAKTSTQNHVCRT